MANQLAPHEVLIEHPRAERPQRVLYSAYLAGKYPGWTIKARHKEPVDVHRVEERGLAVDDPSAQPKVAEGTELVDGDGKPIKAQSKTEPKPTPGAGGSPTNQEGKG